MARVLRSSFPDGYFHVTARGVDRTTPLFPDDDDRRVFLDLAGHAAARHDWILHAYCLMTTHYHLVLEARRADVSSGLKWLNGAYAVTFNRRHHHFGHVFADRFAARLIEGEEYLHDACAYVLLNPVRAGLCARVEDWPWSYRVTGLDAA